MSSLDLRDLGGGTGNGLLASRANYSPDQPAVVFEGTETTYRQLDEGASRVASALISLGLEPGDAVSVFMSSRPEFLMASFGIGRAGLRFVPVNTAYKGSFLEYAIEHSDSRAIITEARLAGPIADLDTLPAAVTSVVYLDGAPERLPQGDAATYEWADLLAETDVLTEFPLVQPGDIGGISYTSGTTGRSKGVLSPSLAGVVMAREVAVAMGTTTRDRLYTCLPLFHGAALIASCLHAIYAGATICLSSRFSASGFWDEIRETEATQFNALGSIIPMLLAQPPSPSDRDHHVQRVFAAPAPPEVLHRFEARFGIHIVEGYGSSETKNVTYNPIQGRKVGSIGKPTASTILEISPTSSGTSRSSPTGGPARGKHGCWDRYCSGTALVHTTIELPATNPAYSTVLGRQAAAEPGSLTGRRGHRRRTRWRSAGGHGGLRPLAGARVRHRERRVRLRPDRHRRRGGELGIPVPGRGPQYLCPLGHRRRLPPPGAGSRDAARHGCEHNRRRRARPRCLDP